MILLVWISALIENILIEEFSIFVLEKKVDISLGSI